VSEMERGDDPRVRPDAPWSDDDGPEPGWADAIRRGRRARGARLREIFAGFADDDGPEALLPRRAADREDGHA